MPTNFHQKLIKLLKDDDRLRDEDDELITAAIHRRARQLDHDLVRLLLSDEEIKAEFFEEIDGHWIFNANAFTNYVSNKDFLANSYTRFRNKTGLNIGDKFLREGGVSESVNWQGGCDFIYYELMKYNQAYMDKIQAAKSSEQLVALWENIALNSFLNWYVNPETPADAVEDFKAIGETENGLDKQKKLLADLLDKNQLYVHLSEIDDEDFDVNEDVKAMNKRLYGES